MNLTLTEQEEAFRDELRAWLERHHPGDEPDGLEEQLEFRRSWQRTLQEARYAGVSWPRAYGGRGATLMEQALFNEEMARAKAPPPLNIIGLVMGGPVVIAHGTAAQKQRYLSPILDASEIWCQGFSEPDAGSDLASLTTRATKVSGGWRVTGEKVWTSYAHKARWMMLLARSDPEAPRYAGMTYYLLDMEQEGVEVRPLRQITGESEFNEVFFNQAWIPDDNVIGGVGEGWTVAITTLMHERAGLAMAAAVGIKRTLAELAAMIVGRGLDADHDIRQRYAQVYIDAETLRLNGYRGLSRIIHSGVPGPEGSMTKWQWADISQALTELAMEVRGADAPLTSSPWAHRFLRARANSIEGGTTEIQCNILAERVLGLPRLR